ncbi:hypothetical protein SDJN02_08850, partial [Cucurbita argyrosperma subsp. argyrosperma]
MGKGMKENSSDGIKRDRQSGFGEKLGSNKEGRCRDVVGHVSCSVSDSSLFTPTAIRSVFRLLVFSNLTSFSPLAPLPRPNTPLPYLLALFTLALPAAVNCAPEKGAEPRLREALEAYSVLCSRETLLGIRGNLVKWTDNSQGSSVTVKRGLPKLWLKAIGEDLRPSAPVVGITASSNWTTPTRNLHEIKRNGSEAQMRRRNGLGLGLDSVVELETQRPRNSNSNRYVAGSSNLFDAHLRFLSLPAGVCAISSPISRFLLRVNSGAALFSSRQNCTRTTDS